MTASAERKMVPENLLVVERGIVKKTIDFQGIDVEIEIKVFTNEEVATLSEEFTEFIGSEMDINITKLAEERVLRGLMDINSTFRGKEWKELSGAEKREYVQVMHPDLREKIGNEIFAKTHLTREERDFLRSPSFQEK